MATAKGANNYNRQNWEDSEFPILCQTCLGDNPYIRMTKERFGRECKICTRPFTIFRWCPGARMRYKKTEVCQTCAKLKNICQTCVLDLEYGLPIQVRDEALKLRDDLPRSDVNKEYYIQNRERDLQNSSEPGGALKSAPASELLLKLARTAPYYQRNRPRICSFWVKGECRRGEECPYRHERPTDPDDPLADQNIRDRYYGVNDPVADKMMRRASDMPKLEPPEDRNLTTLYIGNLGENDMVNEKDLRDHFYQYGEIRSVTVVSRNQCAFIQYVHRSGAEAAVDGTFNKLVINGRRLNIRWGRGQGRQAPVSSSEGAGEAGISTVASAPLLAPPVPGLPGPLPPLPMAVGALSHPPPFFLASQPASVPPPPGLSPVMPPSFMTVHYPSQDPSRLGTAPVPSPAPAVLPPGQ